MNSTDLIGSKANPRFQHRDYTQAAWDPKRKDAGIVISSDNRTVTTPNRSCAYRTICLQNRITGGSFEWTVVLGEAAGCYSAIGVVSDDFKCVISCSLNSYANT